MGQSYQPATVFAVVVLLAVALFCSATEQSDESINIPPGIAIMADEAQSLTEEELGAFRWLEQNDYEKADALRQALENLRQKDAEKNRQDQINRALKWIEKEGHEKAGFLRVLRERDPELFEMQLQEVIEAEIQDTLRQRNREMIRTMIFGTIGGLGLFLFGMGLMSDGLKKVAGQKLKNILESMTRRPWVAFIVGAGVTALIQSSSATTVLVIGFINAGLLTLKQAICVIIGTNVGTTATAWLVSISGIGTLEITMYALPAIGLGFLMQIGGRTRKTKNIGQIILGFGILFVGISFMKNAFGGLENSPGAQALFMAAAKKPILAILAGMAVTMLIQSSSAAVASVQLLAMSGAFGADLDVALYVSVPFILGSNIGTTITAQIAAFRANLNARRAAWAHTMLNVIGAFICVWFIGWICRATHIIAPWELTQTTIAASIAIAHTTIKVFEAVFFLPLAGVLEKMVVRLVPEKPDDLVVQPTALEQHLLETPELAINQVRHEIVRMAQVAKKAVNQAVEGLVEDNRRKLDMARTTEDVTDSLQYEITSYIAALSAKEISNELSAELPVLLHTINDLERVGDHAVNIVEIAERKIEHRISFSESALDETAQLKDQAELMCDNIIAALEDSDIEQAKAALEKEDNLNRMQVDFRRSHVQRMSEGVCSANTGLIFIDLVDNVEKIGDHLTNIAQAVIGGLQWDGVELKVPLSPEPGADIT
ncbi:MAG: Na/Pi cotransporter family protein [Sedimentisphaerales bacterium]